MKSKILEKGVAIYLAIIIMSILLSIGLGLTVTIISQLKLTRNISDSLVAFYAADTGIEDGVYDVRQNGGGKGSNFEDFLGLDCGYKVRETGASDQTVWESKGSCKGEVRAIKIATPVNTIVGEHYRPCYGDCDSNCSYIGPDPKCPQYGLDVENNTCDPSADPPNCSVSPPHNHCKCSGFYKLDDFICKKSGWGTCTYKCPGDFPIWNGERCVVSPG